MRWFRFCILVLALLLAGQTAWGHGFSMVLSADGSSMTPTSEAPLVVGGQTYNNVFFDQFGGGPDPVQTFEGFAFATFSFGGLSNPQFSFNLISPLMYSNGTAAVPASVDPSNPGHLSGQPDSSTSLQIYDRDIGSPTITLYGNSSTVPGFPVTANDPHELEKTLIQFSGNQGDGVYGFAFDFVVKYDLPGGGTGTVSSGPLWDLFNTPNFANNATFDVQNAAALAIYTSVPEPSTFVLALGGLAALAWRLRKLTSRPAATPLGLKFA